MSEKSQEMPVIAILSRSKHLNASELKKKKLIADSKNKFRELTNCYCAVFKVHTKLKSLKNFLDFATFTVQNQH
tara:strand:- start:276 stop:497 length:222 start_codon:yes stop_codon:yes gene_type:complete